MKIINEKEKASALILKQEKEKLCAFLVEQFEIKNVVQFTMKRIFETTDRVSGKRLTLDIAKNSIEQFYSLQDIRIETIGKRKRGFIYEARKCVHSGTILQ